MTRRMGARLRGAPASKWEDHMVVWGDLSTKMGQTWEDLSTNVWECMDFTSCMETNRYAYIGLIMYTYIRAYVCI